MTRISSDRKLEKLGFELKEAIKKATTPIGEIGQSVLELDKRVIQLIERLSSQNDDMDEVKKLIEEVFTRLREVETMVQLDRQKIGDLIDQCKLNHRG